MTRAELAKLAFEECSNAETTVRYGIKRGRPFWNVESTEFMYVPAFHFTAIRDCSRYRYDAVDENGNTHTFEAGDCCALLTPIWRELPEGVVRLTVTALNPDGSDYALPRSRKTRPRQFARMPKAQKKHTDTPCRRASSSIG